MTCIELWDGLFISLWQLIGIITAGIMLLSLILLAADGICGMKKLEDAYSSEYPSKLTSERSGSHVRH
ncbi:MAG: hypothetical protein ACI4JJ_01580 [Huintestinicola sp.]